jgi:hypothetical protein
LTKHLTDKPRIKENYIKVLLSSSSFFVAQHALPANPAALSSIEPWTGRSPPTARKSTVLGVETPPSRTTIGADSVNAIFTKIYTCRLRHLERRPEGHHATAPESGERAEDGRSTKGLHRSTLSRGRDRRHQKLLQPRRHLHDVAGKHPTHT